MTFAIFSSLVQKGTDLGENDGVGLGKHLGVEKRLDLSDNVVHSVGVLLESPKRVNCEFRDFPGLDKSVVVLALGKDCKHVALRDENLHNPGVDCAENGLADNREVGGVCLLAHFGTLKTVLHLKGETI